MPRIFGLLAALCLCVSAQSPELESDWLGVVELPNHKINIVVHLQKTPAGAYFATYDNPDAGVVGMPIRGVKLDGSTVIFEIVPARGNFTGKISDDGTTIAGTVDMPNGKFPMSLRRTKALPLEEPDEPRPLTARESDNVQAFAKLFGYVRHFHPSDGARETDWDEFAIAGIKKVEPANNEAELAAALSYLFSTVAPGVRVWVTGQTEPRDVSLDSAKGMVWWLHNGFGEKRTQGIYRTTLERMVIDPGKMTVVRAKLPGGVDCAVPVEVPTDGSATLPESKPWVSTEKFKRSGNARATRMADVVIVWNVMQHFYPYFDVVSADWAGVLPRALNRAAADKDEIEFAKTLRWMAVELKDGHGGVTFAPEPPRFAPDALWDWLDDRLVITHVGKALGVNPGDTIISVNGTPALQALQEAEAMSAGSTPQNIRYRALRLLGTGAKGETLRLEVEPRGKQGQPRTVELVCDTPSAARRERRPEKITELKPGIWYIDWSRISIDDFTSKLPDLERATGILFDARGYPSFQDPLTFFGHLLPKGGSSPQWHVPVVTQPDGKDMRFERGGEWPILAKSPYLKARKVFLTDGRAISYAESCMGIVEHYKIGEIVGEATAGTNGNVNPLRLPGGYTFAWTGMKVLKHDGSRHHGVGILPTIPTKRTQAGVAAGIDEVLERGLKALD